MRKILLLCYLSGCLLLSQQSPGQFVTNQEATMIANKYIQVTTAKFGPWGGQSAAFAKPAQELVHEGILVGYYCQVDPCGWIVMPIRREFGSVKASSDIGIFQAEETTGLVALIKEKMADYVRAVEMKSGSIKTASIEDVESLLTRSGREVWGELASYVPGSISESPIVTDNYVEGQFLLTTEWDQNAPYNNYCPYLACSETDNGNALVGCVATAGAQIMRYWAWPPNNPGNPLDPYDWPNMKDEVNYPSSPAAQQDAVAELCFDVGMEVDMSYGCDGSSANTEDMVDVFTMNLYHNTCDVLYRSDFEYNAWFMLIQLSINLNRPMQYRIGTSSSGHSIVCDGWRTGVGTGQQYHMNYGWNDYHTAWYNVDFLYNSNPDEEFIVTNIFPYCSLGGALGGTYLAGIRYVDLDAWGTTATFLGGSIIQTLPSCWIKGTGTGGTEKVKFYGNSSDFSLIYTEGNVISGIKIYNGGLTLQNSGMIKMNKQEHW